MEYKLKINKKFFMTAVFIKDMSGIDSGGIVADTRKEGKIYRWFSR
jgi:hypothetical protein